MRRLVFVLVALLPACSLFGPSKPKYVVFFTEQSDALDDSARGVIGSAAYEAIGAPDQSVRVIAYTATGGSPTADQTLAGQRAAAVAAALVADGVPAGRVKLEPRGQTEGDPRVEARRVEIVIVH